MPNIQKENFQNHSEKVYVHAKNRSITGLKPKVDFIPTPKNQRRLEQGSDKEHIREEVRTMQVRL